MRYHVALLAPGVSSKARQRHGGYGASNPKGAGGFSYDNTP